MQYRLGIALFSSILLIGSICMGAVVPVEQPASARIQLGVHTLDVGDRILQLAQAGGYTWVMQLIPWRVVEPVQGQYDWEMTDTLVRAAEYYHLHLIFRVDHQPAWARPDLGSAPGAMLGFPNAPPHNPVAYAAFLQKLAQRYKGRVAAYSIWNEPNLSLEWGNERPDPDAYTALLATTYGVIKTADPTALVIAGNLAPTNEVSGRALDDRLYLQRMYAAGAAHYFDILGVHAYGFAYPPDDPAGAHQGLNFNRVADLRQIMLQNGDADKPVWATEFGWTTIERTDDPAYSWQRVSREQQATYLVQAIDKAARDWPWMKLMVVWNLSDSLKPDDEKYWFSLLDGDGKPKPAYNAIQQSRKQRHGLLGLQW